MKTKLPILVLLLALVIMGFSSCDRASRKSISLPASPPLSSGLGWGLVGASYIKVKSEPSVESADLLHLRDRSLVEIVGRERSLSETAPRELWVKIRSEAGEGWVREAELAVYESKEQAETAKGKLP